MKDALLYRGEEILLDIPSSLSFEEFFPIDQTYLFPLSHRSGICFSSLIKSGERVTRGQKIAHDPSSHIPSLHSPVTGVIEKIEDVRYSEYGTTPCICIKGESSEDSLRSIDIDTRSSNTFVTQLRDAGIDIFEQSRGWQWMQIEEDDTYQIRDIVINGIGSGLSGIVEKAIILNEPDRIRDGIELIKKVWSPERIYLVINSDHTDLKESLTEKGIDRELDLVELKSYYPLGHPLLLYKEIFKEEIPMPNGNPLKMGVGIIGVEDLIHAVDAINENMPLLNRHILVTGGGIQGPKLLKVPVGIPIRSVIDACGGIRGREGRVVLGNPFNGMAQVSMDMPVQRDTKWIFVQREDEVSKDSYRACINCGDCVDICPMNLLPNMLGRYCEFSQFEDAARMYDLFTCIECGLCAYVCPSRRPLVHFIRYGKWELLLKRKGDHEQQS